MNKHRESFWISEEPRNVIFLDHIVQYLHQPGLANDPVIIIRLVNGQSVNVPIERLEELEDALYGRS